MGIQKGSWKGSLSYLLSALEFHRVACLWFQSQQVFNYGVIHVDVVRSIVYMDSSLSQLLACTQSVVQSKHQHGKTPTRRVRYFTVRTGTALL